MYQTSEWVSLGHPDKVADYISCYLLDRYLEKDPNTRFAVEVQIKDNFVTLGGEVTSEAKFYNKDIASFVREAVADVGYTAAYQRKWGADNTINADDLRVAMHLSQQSPDIAQGVNASGWGDQGIFWGMAVNSPGTNYMPADHFLAKKIGQHLYDIRYAGLDIKTQVTLLNGKAEEIVVAIPMLPQHSESDVITAVKHCAAGAMSENCKIIINGTGRYVRHGSWGDCGTTGRKLAVDFYGGNCRIGGGSPWTKDGTKADLTLNLYARDIALEWVKSTNSAGAIYCAISCKIGSPEILVVLFDERNNALASYTESKPPEELIQRYQLRTPRFAAMCKNGLFE